MADVRAIDPQRDAGAVARIVRLSFAPQWGPGYDKQLVRLPRREWRNHRVLVDGGEPVGYLFIAPKQMYIGRALLRIAGIGAVCTDPAARGKGHGRILMEDTADFARREGYDEAVLYGIPNFYHKFGFEVVMARHFMTAAQADLPMDAPRLKVSGARDADAAAILRLYNAQARFRDGNCRRTRMSVPPRAIKLSDARGRLRAYAFWRDAEGTMTVTEAAAADADAGRDLLRAIRDKAWREGLTQVSIQMPPGYPVTDALAGQNAVYHRGYTFRRGCMARILNLASVARKMQAEWTRLAAASRFASKDASTRLAVGGEVLTLRARRGRVAASVGPGRAAATVTPEFFAQMLHGYRGIGGIGAAAASKDASFLDAMFPMRSCFLFGPDKF
jgi:predicted N-acetyltransferase YhbS